MKPGVLPPSTNVVDQSQSTSYQAPHTSDPYGNDVINNANMAKMDDWEKWGLEAQKHVMKLPKDNPFRQLLAATAKFTPPPQGPNASIPLPTPRPNPNEPRPTIFPYNNNKG